MKIGLDATRIGQPTGEGTYTREVILSLLRAFPDDQFFVVIPSHNPMFDFPNVKQVVYRDVDGIAARLAYAFAIGRIVRRYQLDIFHNLTNYAAFGVSCPVVTNVMDLVTLKFPHSRGNSLQTWIYRYVFPRLLSLSSCLVAISENTRQDVADCYGLGERVRVIPCGIDHNVFNVTTPLDKQSLSRFRLPPNYLLFVGYLSPKKNVEIVLRAMHRLNTEGFETHLVLVGKRGYGSETFFALAEKLGLTSRLIETGFVSADELTLLYRGAGLFVFPSLYEGFGLPVVEAMACGAPVLTSNTNALLELLDDPDCLCHPQDLDCWATRIRGALSDPAQREIEQRRGLARARDFSWDIGAQMLRIVYAELVGELRRPGG